ncbi:hypothetical protein EZV62_016121 [Acer yangbiense]|uniref:EamA domain-containing protein n=1 Tax=Acer yangbiense TaxID=1000413 RepID=A0A5C7HQ01_9ROSI|nr:hypothetical protein EZV62_016121 [Acer yangbiense]
MDCNSINIWLRNLLTLQTLYLLLLGQLVSLILASMSFTSSLIATLGVDAPITQTTFNYALLALVYGAILLYRRQRLRVMFYLFAHQMHRLKFVENVEQKEWNRPNPFVWFYVQYTFHGLQVAWYWYLLLGFVDVQGNYLVNKAYQFSSLTSVTLLDCWTIAWAIILTWFFLGTRYSLWQLFGAALSVLGLGLVMLSDAGIGGGGGSKPLLGDVLVVIGTIFFALSNVGEEFFVKKKDRVEVVSMIGVYGLLVSLIQLSILERKNVESIEWSTDIILALAGYTLSSFLFYTMAPFVLKLGGAAMFNLSLLTSDMWAVVIRICFYRQEVDWLYYVAFVVVVIGLVIYSTTNKDPIPVPAHENGNSNVQYQILDDENEAPRH